MKKLFLTFALATALTVTVLSSTQVAEAKDTRPKTSTTNIYYKSAVEDTSEERTDEYALDYYKYNTWADEKMFIDKAKEITKGLTTDYEKAEEIFYWVVSNVLYTYDEPIGLTGIEYYLYGDCSAFTFIYGVLCQAAGIPVKNISGAADGGQGYFGAHEWNRVYADGRWLHVDCTGAQFDYPIERWSQSHILGSDVKDQDKQAFDGTLEFYAWENDKILKEVKGIPLNALITDTYGFDITTLYLDKKYTKPFTLNTMRFNLLSSTIYVKQDKTTKNYTVTFDANGGTSVSSVKATAKTTMKKPSNPTKSGYKFVAWYKDAKLTTKWDFANDKVTGNTTLYAGWVKTYKVTFNSNKGTEVKAVTVAKNKVATQPTNPTKSGYKFAGWYKDAKLTVKWDFAKDKVTGNTTVYAKWTKTK